MNDVKLTPKEVEKWLEPEERKFYDKCCKAPTSFERSKKALESLAQSRAKSEQRRAMLKKHEWVWNGPHEICPECKKNRYDTRNEPMGHAPDCKWAQAQGER